MMSKLDTSLSFNRRMPTFGSPRTGQSPRVVLPGDSWVSRNFHILVIIAPLITFILVFSCGYHYLVPSNGRALHGYSTPHFDDTDNGCDVFSGSWVLGRSYPLYNSSDCPFVEQGFNCLANGRKDTDYLRWRWKPMNCNLPKFDVLNILERLRGKRISFVGDSMGRTQWESMVCLLMTGVEDKKGVYEVNGNKISKTIRYLGVRFGSFNLTVEFFRSVFLVQSAGAPKYGPRRVNSTLMLDKLDDISKEWVHSDVLIFNSGHWWVPSKLFEMGCYFQLGSSLKLGMPITTAFRIALNTWASWVEASVNTNKTQVFFRSFEPSHWSDESHTYCNVTQFPLSESGGSYRSPFSGIIMDIVRNMAVPVTVLRITSLSSFRSDAHVGTWSDRPSVSDCSHWCLPGVPDSWNEIVLFYLFRNSKTDSQ